MPGDEPKGPMLIGQVMGCLGVSREVVVELCRQNVLACVRDKRGWRLFSPSDVERLDPAEVNRVAEAIYAENRRRVEQRQAESAAWRSEPWVRSAAQRSVPQQGALRLDPDADFPVNSGDLVACCYCGALHLAWALSRRTGRSYLVQARLEDGAWIANRRDLHSRTCSGRPAPESTKVPRREDASERFSDDERSRLRKIEKQLGALH